MANHASTRATQLYDRRHDEINLDEVERIDIEMAGLSPRLFRRRLDPSWEFIVVPCVNRPVLADPLRAVL